MPIPTGDISRYRGRLEQETANFIKTSRCTTQCIISKPLFGYYRVETPLPGASTGVALVIVLYLAGVGNMKKRFCVGKCRFCLRAKVENAREGTRRGRIRRVRGCARAQPSAINSALQVDVTTRARYEAPPLTVGWISLDFATLMYC